MKYIPWNSDDNWIDSNAHQKKQWVQNILCDCGELLEVWIKEYKYNLTHGLFKTSKLAQRAYEEGHKICWKEAKVLQIEPNNT
jgi:hypothetical protein